MSILSLIKLMKRDKPSVYLSFSLMNLTIL